MLTKVFLKDAVFLNFLTTGRLAIVGKPLYYLLMVEAAVTVIKESLLSIVFMKLLGFNGERYFFAEDLLVRLKCGVANFYSALLSLLKNS
jgi:hypothetical protein